MLIIRARELQPGDVTILAGEIVIRTFRDGLTPPAKIEVLLRREGEVRRATWNGKRLIRIKRRASAMTNGDRA